MHIYITRETEKDQEGNCVREEAKQPSEGRRLGIAQLLG